ncbi:aminotransferase class III-fold pyridoxal phosphate-dependent enzyme [Vibrio sp. S4M6]|uniref:aminotransferase class III-fold pyridoxal phosphate-dependent enzyme n=1 Tax=Vibrio sinus TaxID=2946865 RepID=UPI00202A4EF9|nr:aminotransferase class III-fold pyridoxal phosphate-dependent enzyme [Vibrio sinus]MCL9781558.1 aminotransferase class III-fold pyridoxal phosphate-dependent enzyme [Vibrio sinus]
MYNYRNSEQLLERALKTIPLGSQTFSKSKTQYPHGVSPYFIQKGKGSRVWDVDGNEYVDYINSLAAITLGHQDPDVDSAVKAQIEEDVLFSLPHPIEMQVAEKLVELVPCAEKVRFGKNGSDATAGAIRLARAFTKRDHVAVCGYHGWQDWYIGSTSRNLGIPEAVQDLTHKFIFNNIESLEHVFANHPKKIAAVILEPMNIEEPHPGFLEAVKELAHHHGALLIFDETITGFRYSTGGAQQLFNVTPDLATFGKGLANGYPLSVLVGSSEVMSLMEEVFFSFTFGGETVSLAAALATLNKLQREPVIDTLQNQGTKIIQALSNIIKDECASDFLHVSGHPSWSFFSMADCQGISHWNLKTLFLQEMFARGILTLGTHNMSYSHCDEDVNLLIKAYEEVIPLIVNAVRQGRVDNLLRCAPIEPLFKVR